MSNKVKLYLKMVEVMKAVGQLVKDGDVVDRTGKKMYSYLSEEQTTAELQSAFIKHGLVMFPIKVEDELIYLETVKYNESIKAPITRVRVTYKIVDAETGESEELQSIGYGSDSQDKGSNKAMTGAFKYVQRQTFMISTGDDGDKTPSAELDEQYKTPKGAQSNSGNQQNNNDRRTTDSPAATSGASGGVKLATEAQVKMLRAKRRAAGFAGNEEISRFIGFTINSLEELPMSKVNELIKFLDDQRIPA